MSLIKSAVGILILFITSCASNGSDGSFLKDGISFTYPTNWSITDQDDLGGIGYYLSIEKKGLNESGLVVIKWLNDDIDKHEYLELIKEDYKNKTLLKNLKFESAKKNSFNGIQSLLCDYSFTTIGVKHKGEINVFSAGDKTFVVIKQGSLDDISGNEKGFQLIESSFKIEMN